MDVTRGTQWRCLETWLKVNHPSDVLMPCPRGEKRPAYTHGSGAWTWARYDWATYMEGDFRSKDVGILLHALCVVDCDTAADADALEARFPELLTAPMETTARGRHYFFQRSERADALGYYDGAAQRSPTVDFKSRAWGGGSGFLVVAPSTNKVWVRTPWPAGTDGSEGTAPVISDALLDGVAVPRHAPLRLRLRFAAEGDDAAPVERTSTLLAVCGYVTMALEVSGEEDTDTLTAAMAAVALDADKPAPPAPLVTFPAQFSAALYGDLERVAAGRDPDTSAVPEPAWLASAEAYEAYIAQLRDFAEFLQAPAATLAALRAAGAGGGRNRGDQMRIDRAWALECMAAARDAEPGRLVPVDAALAATLVHAPLLPGAPRDARWVLHQGPRARQGLPPGTPVLVPNPVAAAEAMLPRFVRDALRNEAGHLALAGGAALAAVATGGAQAADYDLFVHSLTGSSDAIAAAADALVRRVAALTGARRGARTAVVSRSAVTLRVTRDAADNGDVVPPEFVLRVARDPADILSGFDLAPSKVLIQATPPAEASDAPPQLTVLAAPDWVLAMRHGAYALDGRAWSRATALRVFKYAAKGFDALVPALRDRAALRFNIARGADTRWWWSTADKMQHLDGFELLFAIERFISERIAYETKYGTWSWQRMQMVRRPTSRVNARDVERAASRLQLEQRTDYATALKLMNRFLYALKWTTKRGLQRIGAAAPTDALAAPLGWRQPWSRAQFHPVMADITDALQLTDTEPQPQYGY